MRALSFLLVLSACKAQTAKSPAAARVVSEGELNHVVLTPEAVQRLGIMVAKITQRALPEHRVVGGEITVPSGHALQLMAPLAATVLQRSASAGASVKRGDVLGVLAPIAPVDRDTKAQTGRGVSAAEARLKNAEQQVQRAERVFAEGAGSARLVEQAKTDRDVAAAELLAANQRLDNMAEQPLAADVTVTIRAPHDGVVRQVGISTGQVVAAGALLFEVVGTSALWVRVPLFAPEVRRVREDAAAFVMPIGGGQRVEALPAHAPPQADPVASTVDLVFTLGSQASFRPGERVDVELVIQGEETVSTIATSALVRDATGGTWIYEALDDHRFVRRRVEVSRVDGELAVLARGGAADMFAVTVGAGELFSVEFGAGH